MESSPSGSSRKPNASTLIAWGLGSRPRSRVAVKGALSVGAPEPFHVGKRRRSRRKRSRRISTSPLRSPRHQVEPELSKVPTPRRPPPAQPSPDSNEPRNPRTTSCVPSKLSALGYWATRITQSERNGSGRPCEQIGTSALVTAAAPGSGASRADCRCGSKGRSAGRAAFGVVSPLRVPQNGTPQIVRPAIVGG